MFRLLDIQLNHFLRYRDRRSNITDLPFTSDSFDVASSEAAFQMVERLDQALQETHRVLRDGGIFVMNVPPHLYEVLDAKTERFRGFYRNAFQ